MGGALIHRERGNTHLTQLGEMLLPFLKQVYESSSAASNLAREIAEGRGVPLNFGVSDVVRKSALIEPLRFTARSAEGLELHVEGGSDTDLVRRLIEGSLHLSLVDEKAADPERLRFHPVYKERFLILMPETDPLVDVDTLGIEALLTRPWIELVGSAAHLELAEKLQEHDSDWTPRHRATRPWRRRFWLRPGWSDARRLKGAVLTGLVVRDFVGCAPSERWGWPRRGAARCREPRCRFRGNSGRFPTIEFG